MSQLFPVMRGPSCQILSSMESSAPGNQHPATHLSSVLSFSTSSQREYEKTCTTHWKSPDGHHAASTNTMSTSQKPRAYKLAGYQTYTLGICMCPPIHAHDAETPSPSPYPWIVLLSIRGIDWSLLRHGGMYWDTSNVGDLAGRQITREEVPSCLIDLFPSDGDLGHEMGSFNSDDPVRHWTLHEYPDSPMKESRWRGEVALFAKSSDEKAMGAFSLGNLKWETIRAVYVRDSTGRLVYEFQPKTGVVRNDLPFGDLLGDGSRWAWPMESVISVERSREKKRVASNGDEAERKVWLGCPDRDPSRPLSPWMGNAWAKSAESMGAKNLVYFPRR
ncbi:hypothetical protein QBC34DRAFT_499836 [Podospora aff. communis PSN243]|uniref:Uncharacterized protein n=1 Tax=Podospora aff. communis PSN243 TaxID=3040156 RepID=A0AAV9FY34_9PEZI|nr:hypothetical protein QBC34DRAFT_499836 [Podospora aff. communis PSN243]